MAQQIYNENCYLWADNQAELIGQFVATNPLGVDIRDRFVMYDQRTADLVTTNKVTAIGSLVISMQPAFDAFVEYSKVWKVQLGAHLIANYKQQLETLVTFIKDMEFSLSRPLRDLDDVRVAMSCLVQIRENSIE